MRQLLARQFGVDDTLNGVYKLLKRLDVAWISARAVSPNANPARQAEFKKNLSQEGHEGKRWARDIVAPLHNPNPVKMPDLRDP